MDKKMEQHELISALADGEVRGDDFARAVQAVVADPAARRSWHTYHLIGDVLRSGVPGPATAPEAFMARLSARLVQEKPYAMDAATTQRLSDGLDRRAGAANDANFRWKLVAGFASLAAVAAVGWTLVGDLGAKPEQAQLAGAPQPTAQGAVLANGERGTMIRDARLDELLAAHRQFGGASALQMPAGFLRNATFEGPGR